MTNDDLLDDFEARVLGVLIEKELTTPDQYPLSMNALAAGCSQRSNRDPVVEYGTTEVEGALARLRLRQLAGGSRESGSRVEKYRHNAREVLELRPVELATLAELLLRGAQQPGELRARASRMAALPDLAALEATLDLLARREFARRLPPAPGTRAARWTELLSARGAAAAGGAVGAAAAAPATAPVSAPAASAVPTAPPAGPPAGPPSGAPLAERVAALEVAVADLRADLADLRATLGEPREE